MSVTIDYDKLYIKWDCWDDVPMIADLFNKMNDESYEWHEYKANLKSFLQQHYNLNINII